VTWGNILTGEDILMKRRAKIEERVTEKERKNFIVSKFVGGYFEFEWQTAEV